MIAVSGCNFNKYLYEIGLIHQEIAANETSIQITEI